MKLDVYNTNHEKVKDYTLNKEIFGIEANEKVLKDAIILAMASLRQGTHKAKTRAEVRGGGRKPWRQKGTGNARQGSIRSVQWVGGGIAFGPVPRDYSKKQNRKERKLALKSAYSSLASNNSIFVVDHVEFATPKTKEMLSFLKSFGFENEKVLLVVNEYEENVILAARNLQNVILTTAKEVGVLDLVSVDKVIIEEAAMKYIEEVLQA